METIRGTSVQNKSLEAIDKRNKVLETIQNIVVDVIQSLAKNELPSFILRNQRLWGNCTFNEILELKEHNSAVLVKTKFLPNKTNKEFAQMMFLLWKVYQLLSQNSSASRREIYYENLDLFEDQSELDAVADKVSCLLGVPQWEIGLFHSSKGLVAGSLRIRSDTFNINCSVHTGALIPNDLPLGVTMESNAKFVLVIEKDSAFQKLCDEGFLERHGPCIMITGKGYPDVSTRVMVKYLSEELLLPVFILVDSDPHGIEIMCIYKYGSLKQSHIGDRLAIPSAKWIGVHPTDVKEFNIPSKDLSERDLRKVTCLLTRPYIDKDKFLRDQLQFLHDRRKKCEIEGLAKISLRYLTDVFIPVKLFSL